MRMTVPSVEVAENPNLLEFYSAFIITTAIGKSLSFQALQFACESTNDTIFRSFE